MMSFYSTFLRIKLNFVENFSTIFKGIVSISLTLSIFGVLFLLYTNLISISNGLFAVNKHTVLYDNKSTEVQNKRLHEFIKQFDAVSHIKDLSSEQLFQELLKDIEEKSDKTANLIASSLPQGIEFTANKNTANNAKLFEKIAQLSFVETIISSNNVESYVNNFFIIIKIIGIILLIFIAIIVFIAITNAIELSIYNHKKEIDVYLHLGAKPLFILTPYFYESLFIIFSSIFIAVIIVFLIFNLAISTISNTTTALGDIDFVFLSSNQIGFISIVLIILSLLSAIVSFLKIIRK